MDFSFTDEQRALKQSVIAFAKRELNDGLASRDKNGEFSREGFRKCAELGILGLALPPEYGGSGSDILSTVMAMEGLGYGCRDNGLLFAMNAQMWSVQAPILSFGTTEQKERYLPRLCRGEIVGAHGMTEPSSGSDAYSLRARAERRSGGYVLSGTKTFVTSAPIADIAVVFATVDPSKGLRGVTAFVVERGTPGFEFGRSIDKMGLRTSPMGELILEDCFVPESARLGAEGAGTSIFNHSMEWERSGILASHVGAMERQLEECVHYARERRQFDQPIGKFQSISGRIAEMKVRLETSRLLLYKVAWLKSVGKNAAMEAAMVKLYVSECFVQSSLDALRIHGGYGYTTELGIERDVRDSIGGTIYSGTSDIQRVMIARLLGL